MASLVSEALMTDHFGMFTGNTEAEAPRRDEQPSDYNQNNSRKVAFQLPDHYRNYQQNSQQSATPKQPATAMSQGSARASSPDDSNTSGEKGSSHIAKTGRKGDPRMHRAVAARLTEPNMTLFEALKAGGFDYLDDNNPNCVDAENITLAQRKNQLSRRLRIARRAENYSSHPPPSASDTKNKFESLVEKQKQSFQMMQQSMELERRTSSSQYPASGLKRARSAPQNGNGIPNTSSPGYLGDAHRPHLDDEDEPEVKPPPPMMAKYHPQFHPILVPPTGLHYAQSAPGFHGVPGMGTTTGGGVFFPAPSFQIPNMAHTNAPGQGNTSNHQETNGNASSSNTASKSASGVAIRSLINTAQSVGLSLEQLALALSSTRNLAQVVLGDEDDKNPATAKEQKRKKHNLALQLYRHEAPPVYARCMMMAGFKSEATTEDSKDYLKFAWQAWQREGRRLRNLLEENDMLVADAPDFVEDFQAKNKKQRMHQAESARHDESMNFSHSHARGCHTEDGRHIHRIEKCGHKAILHQPKDGEAHIDFVVGDKVECYEGIGAREGSSWPSLYHCDHCDTGDSAMSDTETPRENGPKILDLKGIDLGGSEWNVDFVDGTLQGLVRLGEGQPGRETNLDSISEKDDSYSATDEAN